MKKLFVVLFVMLFAGMMMAQDTTNVAETEQTGSLNDALVKQIGDENHAESHQYGNRNGASVIQTGDYNVGVADQLNGNRNSADVLQEGNANAGYIVQGMVPGYMSVNTYNQPSDDNVGDVVQKGNSNLGYILQTGNNNDGEVTQDGNNNTGVAYTGWSGAHWGFDGVRARLNSKNSVATIEQVQDDNYAVIYQYGGSNNEVNITQDGNGNHSQITQGFIYDDFAYDFTYPIFNTQDNYATVDQIGNNNYGKVMQLGDGNSFKLNQTGDGNWVGYHPDESGTLLSRNAYFKQDGNNNKFAGVYKDANDNVSFWENQDAEQYNGAELSYESYQKGDYNKIGLYQTTDDFGLIQQDGDFNTSLLYQYGVDVNEATMMQTGNSNTAEVVQIQQ